MEKICPSVGGAGKNTSRELPVLPTRETHQSPFSFLALQPIQEELEERIEGGHCRMASHGYRQGQFSLPIRYPPTFPWRHPSRASAVVDPGEVGRNVSLT